MAAKVKLLVLEPFMRGGRFHAPGESHSYPAKDADELKAKGLCSDAPKSASEGSSSGAPGANEGSADGDNAGGSGEGDSTGGDAGAGDSEQQANS